MTTCLPAQRAARPFVDATHRLFQPAGLDIVGAQIAGDTALLQPSGIHDQPFGKVFLKPVNSDIADRSVMLSLY